MSNTIKNKSNRWWQLFKTGEHTTNSGEIFSADPAKLDAIIEATKNHSYHNDDIPLCIGHKKDDSPKWGAFKKDSFKRAGDILLGRFEYLVKEFAEALDRRMFDKISIALYPDLAIKHIAVLGVDAPAIKGLAPILLSAEDEPITEIEFSECRLHELDNSFLNSLKKFIRHFAEKENTSGESGTSQEIINDSPQNKEEHKMEVKTVEQVTKEFSEKLSAVESALSEKKKEILELKQKQAEQEIKEFCESPVMIKKITPAFYPHVREIYLQLSADNAEYEFSEGEGTIKSTKLESFKKILSALPDAVEFNEHATKQKAAAEGTFPDTSEFSEMTVNESSMELHCQALKIQHSEKCSYLEAVKKASKQP